jgi:hypothetical protein
LRGILGRLAIVREQTIRCRAEAEACDPDQAEDSFLVLERAHFSLLENLATDFKG